LKKICDDTEDEMAWITVAGSSFICDYVNCCNHH